MITRLRGILLEKLPPNLAIEVGGLAYELQASMQTFYHLPAVGKEIILHTHFVVREDVQQLYGFHELRERALFRTLLKVNGIGPKIALAILSSIDADAFVRCVTEQNTLELQRLPGIGKKTAERLVIEMRDRLQDWQSDINVAVTTTPTGMPANSGRRAEQDAISALIALGYKPQEASRAITQIGNSEMSSEELIRLALKGITA